MYVLSFEITDIFFTFFVDPVLKVKCTIYRYKKKKLMLNISDPCRYVDYIFLYNLFYVQDILVFIYTSTAYGGFYFMLQQGRPRSDHINRGGG